VYNRRDYFPEWNFGMTRQQTVISWVFQILVAAILLQTLYFKFTASEESVYIFTTLGVEPWGRIAAGVSELIAAALLLIPRAAVFGAIVSIGIISGAIMSHLTKLGFVVKDDGGLLFGLAITVFIASLAVLFLRRHEIPFVGKSLRF